MDSQTRAALLKRLAPFFDKEEVIPETWGEIPLTTRLNIESQDFEAASVFKGRGFMSADVESKVLSGTWCSDPVPTRNFDKERREALDAAAAALTFSTPEEIEAKHQQERAIQESARMNSLRLAGLG